MEHAIVGVVPAAGPGLETAEREEWFAITDGTILQTNYESHRRGKNWVATVERNLKSPGGLDRDFWDRRGDRAFIPEDLTPGQWIEMAGDYYTGGGGRTPNRKYFRVVAITDEALHVESVQKGDIGTNEEATDPLARFSDEQIRAAAILRGIMSSNGEPT